MTNTRWLGTQRIDLEVAGSTNDEAARLARAGARHGTIVIAERQTAGRGREGRPWSSPPGMGLYLSAVLRPPLPLALVPPLTLAVGVAVCDAAIASGADAALKWPNDTLVGDRKLAGVLLEAHSQGGRIDAVIVGIGVNLAGELPPEVAGTAITLEQAIGLGRSGDPRTARANDPGRTFTEHDRDAFLARLLASVERWVDRYVACGLPAIAPEWHRRMAPNLVARATVDGVPLIGRVVGLDDDGALLLRDTEGCHHRVSSGDVEVIRPTPAPEPRSGHVLEPSV